MRTKGGNLMTNNWAVVRKGGSIESFGKGKEYHGMPIIADNLTREEAKTLAARRRKSLSPGERSYYKMGYSIVQIRKNPKGGNPMAKKPRRPKQMKIMGIPVIPAVVVGGLVYWLYKNK